MNLARRQFLHVAAGAISVPFAPHIARSQTYPSRPVTLIVFAPAGGAPDIAARFVGQALSQRIGQPVVIDNRPGAGGNLALQAVARAEPDGHTLLLVATPHAINATLYEDFNVKVVRDIAPVAGISSSTHVMVISPKLPVATVAEFVAYAKANPGAINLTSSGAGNLSHLAGELFKTMAGIEMIHVPYRGAVQAHAGLMAGDVHVMFDALSSALPQIKGNRLRALAITSRERSKSLPDMPTVAEFVAGYVVSGFIGVGAPKNTPPAIVERLNKDVNAVMADQTIVARFAESASEPLTGSAAEFGMVIAQETEKWAKVIRAANIKPD